MALGTGAGSLWMGVAAAALIGLGTVVVFRPAPAPDTGGEAAAALPVTAGDAEAVGAVAPELDGPTDAPTDAPEGAVATQASAATVAAPVRETFFMFPDGFATIAGRAAPNAEIEIKLAGTTLERITADASGGFGVTVFIEPSDQPRRMQLIADPDGAAVPSEEVYFVQPTVVAEVPAAEIPASDGVVADASETPTDAASAPTENATAAPMTQTADAAAPSETVPVEEMLAEAGTTVVADVDAQAEQPDVTDVVQTDADLAAAVVTSDVSEVVEPTQVQDAGAVETALPEATTTAETSAGAPADNGSVETVTAATSPVDTTRNPDPVAAMAAPEDTPTVETAPAAPAVLVADADGVRVLQPASDTPPEVMSHVALDTISYDPAGEVLLAGRGAGDGFVQVYLDNQPITTSRINDQGAWQIDLPDVDRGVYTLRIDEVTAEGDVVSRIETPFQREEAADVAAVFANETEAESFDVAVRTVQPGSTLWAIAQEQFGEGIMYVEVFEANRDRIRDPDLIYPGQIFRIPDVTQ